MTNQTNEAIERYKLEIVNDHGDRYIRCEPASDGSWIMFKDVAMLQSRIADLEVAINAVHRHAMTQYGIRTADQCSAALRYIDDICRAALEGGKKDG